jgi:hypothetical protein
VNAAKLCGAVLALAILASAHVTILPGWRVPLAGLLLMVILGASAALAVTLAVRLRGGHHAGRHARPSGLLIRRWTA